MALLKQDNAFWGSEVGAWIRDAGFARPTALQQEVIPLILKGKDLAVEAEEGTGKTAAFIVPVLLRARSGKPGIKAVVLAPTVDQVRKIVNEIHRLASSRKKAPSVLPLGLDADTRREARQVQENPDVLVGTPEKVIDHIRRGSVDFSPLQMVVIDRPVGEENPEFDDDVRFIFSKLPPRRQTVLFSPTLDGQPGSLLDLLRHPSVVSAQRWRQKAPAVDHLFYEATPGEKLELLRDLILSRDPPSLLIVAGTPGEAERISRELRHGGLENHLLHPQLPPPRQQGALEAAATGRRSILVATWAALAGQKMKWVTDLVQYELPAVGRPYGPEGFARTGGSVLRAVLTLGSEADYRRIQEAQEKTKVEIEKEDPPSEEDVVSGSIRRIVGRIREEGDREELAFYRQQIRRNVPLLLRPAFMAWLLKNSLSGTREKKERFTKLFVSIGKNRQVFSRDLADLFMSKLNLKRPQIGEVKVLENYSFIEVANSRAKDAINALSGTDFKGRKIAVNFARKKKEEKPAS